MWCHGHCTASGVAGIPPYVVLQALHRVVLQALYHVVLQALHCVWYRGHGCCATWCCSCNHHCCGHRGWWLGCGRLWKERTATRLSARRGMGEGGDWTKKKEDIPAEGKMLPIHHSLQHIITVSGGAMVHPQGW